MNQINDIAPSELVSVKAPALLYEMIRSFVVLADKLNLSHAVKELDITRQTVRRHIAHLEEMRGAALFTVDDRKYQLTDHGIEALPEAIDILARGKVWAQGSASHIDGLLRLSHEGRDGWTFFQQQQPLTQIWDKESPVLLEVFKSWVASSGALEHPDFQRVRPFVLVYRESPHGWLCIEVGQESFYTKWWGWANARSSIGRPLSEFPGGPEFEAMLNLPFREVQANGGVRLDEVVTKLPREAGGKPIPLAYKRLLLASRFPDGSFALVAAVDRTRAISIAGIDQDTLRGMPADAVVSF